MQTSIVIKVWNMSLQPSCDVSWAHAMCDVGPHETGGDVTSECHTSCHITANMSRRLPWHMTTRIRLREPQNIAFYGPRHIEITPENVYLYSIFWMWSLRGVILARDRHPVKAKGDKTREYWNEFSGEFVLNQSEWLPCIRGWVRSNSCHRVLCAWHTNTPGQTHGREGEQRGILSA